MRWRTGGKRGFWPVLHTPGIRLQARPSAHCPRRQGEFARLPERDFAFFHDESPILLRRFRQNPNQLGAARTPKRLRVRQDSNLRRKRGVEPHRNCDCHTVPLDIRFGTSSRTAANSLARPAVCILILTALRGKIKAEGEQKLYAGRKNGAGRASRSAPYRGPGGPAFYQQQPLFSRRMQLA